MHVTSKQRQRSCFGQQSISLIFHVILQEARRYHKWSKVEVIGNWKYCYGFWELIHLWFHTKPLSLIFLVLFNLLCIDITAGLGDTPAECVLLSITHGWIAQSLHKAEAGTLAQGLLKWRVLNEDCFDRHPCQCAAMGVSPAGHILPAGEKSNTFRSPLALPALLHLLSRLAAGQHQSERQHMDREDSQRF